MIESTEDLLRNILAYAEQSISLSYVSADALLFVAIEVIMIIFSVDQAKARTYLSRVTSMYDQLNEEWDIEDPQTTAILTSIERDLQTAGREALLTMLEPLRSRTGLQKEQEARPSDSRE